ncbi:hypothetical protein [Geofilum rubicundum]|uniref:Uncharacterized protein n=1 Tax=Geofilum rubicundum JCM 15548 TaxID=1236989 RepID=A0A0E9LXT9_9BACT|nr:hypothetical protein [Geofilum rubicundum]GAO30069.1 hypothetical protein JCM15548_12316 [Geofilum rubicundum JCM 15548]
MKSYFLENQLIDKLSGFEPKKLALAIKALKGFYYSRGSSVTDMCKLLKISAPNGVALLSELIDRQIIEKKGLGNLKEVENLNCMDYAKMLFMFYLLTWISIRPA